MEKHMISALGIGNLPKEEQEEILAKVNRRLDEIVLRVFVENLSEEETKKATEIFQKGEDISEKITELSASLPLLAEKLEQAVSEEIERLRLVLKK